MKNNNEIERFALDKHNYRLIIIGCVIVLIGFVLMMGGGSEDPNVFNEEIFSARRITVAPITVMAGYMFIIYAIMKRPKEGQS
jgi:NADH:ubiquinone oxidoreductase subunit 6 (subunit J)